ncbi:MAG: DUF3422 family protein [Vitreimonas sp.]
MLKSHLERTALLAEIHARPFQSCAAPTRFLHFAFATDAASARADKAALDVCCTRAGRNPPAPDARHHSVILNGASLRWEQHAEFTTYSWSAPLSARVADTDRLAQMRSVTQSGPLLVAVDLTVARSAALPAAAFDEASLAKSWVYERTARVATDFRADADGFVHIHIENHDLTPAAAGSLAQRLLELETYRILALRGLLKARELHPEVDAIEAELTRVTSAMTSARGSAHDSALLRDLTHLAARLEAGAAGSLYRFAASRAYAEIVEGRLQAIGEQAETNFQTVGQFLSRRLAPAMRTCVTMEERQAGLSRKLARAAQLLRTRVDVELARQNRDLLSAMNERTHLQMRLQHTLEGLSVAAISYYALGLLGYAAKAVHALGLAPAPELVLAALAPFVIVGVAYVIHRARRSMSVADGPAPGFDRSRGRT